MDLLSTLTAQLNVLLQSKTFLTPSVCTKFCFSVLCVSYLRAGVTSHWRISSCSLLQSDAPSQSQLLLPHCYIAGSSSIADLIKVAIKNKMRLSRGPGSTTGVASFLPNCPTKGGVSWSKCKHTTLRAIPLPYCCHTLEENQSILTLCLG